MLQPLNGDLELDVIEESNPNPEVSKKKWNLVKNTPGVKKGVAKN